VVVCWLWVWCWVADDWAHRKGVGGAPEGTRYQWHCTDPGEQTDGLLIAGRKNQDWGACQKTREHPGLIPQKLKKGGVQQKQACSPLRDRLSFGPLMWD